MNNEYPDSPNTYSVIILQKVKIEIYTKIYQKEYQNILGNLLHIKPIAIKVMPQKCVYFINHRHCRSCQQSKYKVKLSSLYNQQEWTGEQMRRYN